MNNRNSQEYFKNLFIFEMANNHMGNVAHGIDIINEFAKICQNHDFKFAFKFQYRDLNTFIHPAYQTCFDQKYIKRFAETKLNKNEQKKLHDEAKKCGFITICTPFDENSVDLIEEHNYDIIKIGSCSFTDWPLLERVVKTNKPIIASTAGASLEQIDNIVSFLENREKCFAIMHCVGEYPSKDSNLQLNQIDLLRNRYVGIPIGYSTHESPDNFDAIKIAIAKGAIVFEKHVGLKTNKYNVNAYSATPTQIASWLEAAKETWQMCGNSGERIIGTEQEKIDLRGLQRGIFAKKMIRSGETINLDNAFFAIPNSPGQIVANEMSKYAEIIATTNFSTNQPILHSDVIFNNVQQKVITLVKQIGKVLKTSGIPLPEKFILELSHHYGIDKFAEWGASVINYINREYCKKLIILLPGQKHPSHFHKKKEETFHVLFGQLHVKLGNGEKTYNAGEMIMVEREAKHGFSSETGAIFEEISTTSYQDDSFYDDPLINKNPKRKTSLTVRSNWLFNQ